MAGALDGGEGVALERLGVAARDSVVRPGRPVLGADDSDTW